jgi:putative nucleotidyltransferase with HDIG domain
MTVSDREVLSKFPDIAEIKGEPLRKKVLRVWARAFEPHVWSDVDRIPMSPGGPRKLAKHSLIDHTRCVTMTARDLTNNLTKVHHLKIEMDAVIAGAVLHDVGKSLMGRMEGGKFVVTDEGRKLTHIVLGSMLAKEEGLPLDIIHAIFAHTVPYVTFKATVPPQTIEALIVHYADFGAGDPIFFDGKVALLCNPIAPMWSPTQ